MDRVKAGEYFRKAALLGNAHAQYNLATLYVQHPDALTKDKRSKTDALALQWFKKSAAAGHPAAMAYLADVYTYGKLGQRPNRKLAASWKQKADAAEEKRKRAQTITPLPRTEAARPRPKPNRSSPSQRISIPTTATGLNSPVRGMSTDCPEGCQAFRSPIGFSPFRTSHVDVFSGTVFTRTTKGTRHAHCPP